jgi:hypothetical protein
MGASEVKRLLDKARPGSYGESNMLFRYRHYCVVPGKITLFNDFFQEWLLPIQLRHGAQLVGRWQTEDGSEIVALWAYASMEAYRAIGREVERETA